MANQLKQSIYFPGDFVTLDCRILANGLRLSLSVSFWILLDRAVGTGGQGVIGPPNFGKSGRAGPITLQKLKFPPPDFQIFLRPLILLEQ